MADDQEPKDTRVLEKKDTPFDMEGTAEMDRSALLARLQADAQSNREPQVPRESSEVLSATARKTEQNPSVTGATKDPTQHYVVPDSLLEQSRVEAYNTLEVKLELLDDNEQDDELPTTTFSMDAFLEFEAVVDAYGRIALPESALKGKFGHGARLKVVVHPLDSD